jgi:hypothetical protein
VLVTVISRGLAERYWPEQTAIGHRLKLGLDDSSDPWRTVVGIVGDVRRFDPTTPPPPQLYLPLSQQPIRSLTYFVTTEDEPDAHADAVRASVWKVDPQQPVEDLRTLEEAVDELYAGVELGEHMLTALGIIAVILAASGIYSVFSYSIARRQREIAIRMAFGAGRSDLLRSTVLQGARCTHRHARGPRLEHAHRSSYCRSALRCGTDRPSHLRRDRVVSFCRGLELELSPRSPSVERHPGGGIAAGVTSSATGLA